MSFAQNMVASAVLAVLQQKDPAFLHALPSSKHVLKRSFDPELLYVECRRCSSPVLWDKGKTTQLLESAQIPPASIDAHCLIVSEGCPMCSPGEHEGYLLSVVRMASLTLEEAGHMARKGGNA